jgi:hypothetical protein
MLLKLNSVFFLALGRGKVNKKTPGFLSFSNLALLGLHKRNYRATKQSAKSRLLVFTAQSLGISFEL